MDTLQTLRTPALVLDLDVLERNIETMAARAEALGVALRPHFKTHKCARIAALQVARSAAGGTVATLEEARYFADHGIDDLTWAFPLICDQLDEVADLASRIRLQVVIDSFEALDALRSLGTVVAVAIKVDCGYHRAGVDPESEELSALAHALVESTRLEFAGLLTHSGHAYSASSPEIARRIANEERDVMKAAADRLVSAGLPRPWLSVGSTPAMCAVRNLDGIDEARPGNYALFDFTQVQLGSCRVSDCAATVVTSVVSNARAGAVVDAGALALSKDPGPAHLGGRAFGEIFEDYSASRLYRQLRVRSLSQEHGKLSGPAPVGARLRILPNHSCLAVAHFDEYAVVRGDELLDRWPIHRAR